MNIASLSLPIYQLIVGVIIYVCYLGFVMFGGLRKKRIKPIHFILMIIILFWALTKTYSGLGSFWNNVDLIVVLIIAVVKGITLGNKKQVKMIDNSYYIWHEKEYIILWSAFFVGKVLFTLVLGTVFNLNIPIWHMIAYFFVYFTVRTLIIVRLYPEAFQRK
ncbi:MULTISPECIES: hypothetical protein [unclassified Companilactobacillus]|jgi:hypothetical protein|uniref:hypothetical protein n=1 Tax=unclassified Companilactobacillus TaxID=2767904 RepID=UPI002FF24DD6